MRGTSVYEETMFSNEQLPKAFGMKITILGCENIGFREMARSSELYNPVSKTGDQL